MLWKNTKKSYTISPMKVIGNSRYQKSLNGALILNYLLQKGGATRIELAEQLGLQPSTITYIVNRFIQIDLIHEGSASEKKRGSGRPAVQLQLNRNYGRVIGIEMQADYYNAVICDTVGTVTKQLHKEYSGPSESFEHLLHKTIDELQKHSTGPALLGVGVAIPGIVHPQTATIEKSISHNIKSLCISGYLNSNFSFPVVLENDANCCALHTLWKQKGSSTDSSADSFLYVLPRFHTVKEQPPELPAFGIGIGIVIEGKLYRGVHHRAGEFRSSFLRRFDYSEVSLSIEETHRLKNTPTLKRRLITEILQNLGFAVSLLNPSFIILGGDLAGEERLITETLTEELKSTKEYLDHSGCTIKIFQDVSFDAAEGAAANILNELYRVPQAGTPDLSAKKWSHMLANAVQ